MTDVRYQNTLIAPYQQRADAAEARADAAEAREWALGVQVVAQAARLRLATETIEAAKTLMSGVHERPGPAYHGGIVATLGIDSIGHLDRIRAALAAWDAVQGDDDNKETT